MKKITIILLSLMVLSVSAWAENDDDWVKLGEKTVAFKVEKDKVTLTGKEKNVTKIKITCIQGAVKIKNIYVTMSDGSTKTIDPMAGVLKAGMSTKAFDLPGKDLKLTELELEYDSMGTIVTNKKAKVEIYGKKQKEDKKE